MIGLDTEGRLRRREPQQQWLVEQGSNPATAQYANFVGHRLTVLAESGGGYGLHYLGYTEPCESIEDGKAGACEFAQRVLDQMKSEIVGQVREEEAMTTNTLVPSKWAGRIAFCCAVTSLLAFAAGHPTKAAIFAVAAAYLGIRAARAA